MLFIFLLHLKYHFMAFGSFFKKLWEGAKNIARKALPVIQKGLDIASKVAPAIGGAISAAGRPDIGGIIATGGSIAGGASRVIDNLRGGDYGAAGQNIGGIINDGKTIRDKRYREKPRIGADGHGIRRFDVPQLK